MLLCNLRQLFRISEPLDWIKLHILSELLRKFSFALNVSKDNTCDYLLNISVDIFWGHASSHPKLLQPRPNGER